MGLLKDLVHLAFLILMGVVAWVSIWAASREPKLSKEANQLHIALMEEDLYGDVISVDAKDALEAEAKNNAESRGMEDTERDN